MVDVFGGSNDLVEQEVPEDQPDVQVNEEGKEKTVVSTHNTFSISKLGGT